MRITSVRLTNIKSYVDETIALTPGTNAVWGPNGSGKTTLVESIGFALFDYLPYGQKAFVREGEPAGTIRIRLIALDDREYEVVRQLGKTRSHYVFDLDLNEKIEDGTDNVLDWTKRNAIGSDGGDDLEFLFVNAVGVPQGMMTAGFRQSPAQRKATFDKLLGVEEYEDTWRKLLETEGVVKQRMAAVVNTVSKYQGETERLPALEAEAAQGAERLEQGEKDLEAATGRLKAIEGEVERLETLERECTRTLQTAREAGQTHTIAERDLKASRDAESHALQAKTVVAEAAAGYETYCSAQKELESLEPLREAREQLRREAAQVRGLLEAAQRERERVEAALEASARAAETVERLAPQFQRLCDRRAEHDRAKRAVDTKQGLESRLETQLKALGELSLQLEKQEAEIEKLEALRLSLPDTPQLETELDQIREEFTQADAAQRRANELALKRKSIEENIRILDTEAAASRQRLRRLEELRGLSLTISSLESAERDADVYRRRIDIDIQFQDLARSELLKQRCPLLDLTCPASGDKSWVEKRFKERLDCLKDEQTEAMARHGASSTALAGARNVLSDLPALEEEFRELGRLDRERDGLTREREEMDQEVLRIDGIASRRETLRTRGVELRKELDEARAVEKSVAGLDAIRMSRDLLASHAKDVESESRALRTEIEPLAALVLRLPDLDTVIGQSGPLEAEYQDAVRLRDERPRLEEGLARVEDERAALGIRVARTESKLECHADLDLRLGVARVACQAHHQSYELYLRHKSDADAHEERVLSARVAAMAVQDAEETARKAEEAARVAAGRFDSEKLLRARGDRETAIREEATIRNQVEVDGRQLEKHRLDIAALRERMLGLKRALDEKERLETTARDVTFIRDVIRASGPAVTETLVQNVSQNAATIFGDILDDHAMDLSWQKDYEIVVRRGAEDRSFFQLSGGEQMSAALAIRLALIKQVSEVGVAFFDEPTQNLDVRRRSNLAEQIQKIHGFDQLLVISHDDSFEEHTDNVVRLSKEGGRTVVR